MGQVHPIGHPSADAEAAVHGGDAGGQAQAEKVVQQNEILLPGKAQDHMGPQLSCQKLPRQTKQGRYPAAPADEQGTLPGQSQVEAVSQAGEHVQLRAGLQGAEKLRPLAHLLHDQGEVVLVPVADGEGAAQEEARERQGHELPRPFDAGAVPLQAQAAEARVQLFVFDEFKNGLFHTVTRRWWRQ